MSTTTKVFFSIVAMVLFTTTTFAQISASANVTATILAPITITKTVDMNFGNMAVNATDGTVALAADGVRTNTGGVTFLSANPGTVTAAAFTIGGLAGSTYAITLPTTDTDIDNSGNTMTVNNWVSTPSGNGTLDGSGTQTLTVGATLTVKGGQTPGIYTKAAGFEVTVNYN